MLAAVASIFEFVTSILRFVWMATVRKAEGAMKLLKNPWDPRPWLYGLALLLLVFSSSVSS